MTRLAPHRLLRSQILDTLHSQGEIVSVFNFLCDHGFYGYAYGLGVFRMLAREGRIVMTKVPGRGQPWRITLKRNHSWTIPPSMPVDSCAESQPELLPQ